MGSELDDLSFKIDGNIDTALASLNTLARGLDDQFTKVFQIDQSFRHLGNAVAVPVAQVQTLTNRIRPMVASAVNGLESIANAGEVVDSTMHTAAFAVDGVARSLENVSKLTGVVAAGISSIQAPTAAAGTALAKVSDTAGILGPRIMQVSSLASDSARGLRSLAFGARVVAGTIGRFSELVKVASGSLLHFVHMGHAAKIVVSLLATAFNMIMVPVRLLGSLIVAVGRVVITALNTILLPVKWLWQGFAKLASFMLVVVSTSFTLALAAFKVWFVFKGWIGALKVVGSWLSMLPPKMRLVVGGLLALGMAGKVSSAALNVAAFGLRMFGTAVKAAGTAARVLLLPVLAIRSPMAALRSAAVLAGQGLAFTASMGLKAADAIHRVASAAGRSVSAFAGKLAGGAKQAAVAFGLMAVAAVAWGTSTAIASEKNDVIFGTMLKNMGEGKAVVDSLQSTQAAGLFDNKELLDSGRLLFKAGISAADLAGKTDQLAGIAAATSTELGDLARIYQQGAVTGSFGQDKINQLAERGIDIYHALEASTGKSGEALKEMISDGKIGLKEMDGALAHLTEGNGIYAGALENIGGTTSGLFARLKNTVQQTLGQLMGYGLGIFKPILAAGVAFTEKLKLAIVKLEPAFTMFMTAVSGVMTAGWNAISEVASGVFIMMFGEGQLTFDSIVTWAARMLGGLTYIMNNIGLISSYAWKTMQLGAAMAFNDIVYFFTDTIPAYLTWFSENWANVFMDAGNVIVTVFAVSVAEERRPH